MASQFLSGPGPEFTPQEQDESGQQELPIEGWDPNAIGIGAITLGDVAVGMLASHNSESAAGEVSLPSFEPFVADVEGTSDSSGIVLNKSGVPHVAEG